MLGLSIYLHHTKRDLDRSAAAYTAGYASSDVIMVCPESRQSTLLKARVDPGLAAHLGWERANVQDIIDESDHVLHPRAQLVYPMGEADLIDGGFIRWGTIEACLDIYNRRAGGGPRFIEWEDVPGSAEISPDQAQAIITKVLNNESILAVDHTIELTAAQQASFMPGLTDSAGYFAWDTYNAIAARSTTQASEEACQALLAVLFTLRGLFAMGESCRTRSLGATSSSMARTPPAGTQWLSRTAPRASRRWPVSSPTLTSDWPCQC